MLAMAKTRSVRFVGLFLVLAVSVTPAWAQPQEGRGHVLTLEQAVAWTLANNPELAVARGQRGIAEAGVVIARTYPFNPVWGSAILGVSPPRGDEVTNRVFNQ